MWFRADEASLSYLRDRGVNPNRFAREAFEATLRRLRAQQSAESLADVQAKLPRPVEELVRDDRDR